MADDDDWRLEAELGASPDHHGLLEDLRTGVRAGGHVASEAQAAVGSDVAITHDGRRLFAYAGSESRLDDARSAIEGLLQREGIGAQIRLSHWDQQLDTWRQTFPPLDAVASAGREAAEAAAETVETQTVVCSAGKLVRTQVEAVMGEWADKHGLRCELVEHPHLLTTQIAFTLTGPQHEIAEFRSALRAEGWATFRADGFGTGLA